MLRARITEEPNGDIALETPYHAEIVSWLKTLPYGTRQWNGERRRWLISALYATEVLAALAEFDFTVQDDRASAGLSPVGDEGAALWAPAGMPLELASALYQLGLNGEAPLELAVVAFHWWAKILHPDRGGDAEQFNRITTAIATIREYLE